MWLACALSLALLNLPATPVPHAPPSSVASSRSHTSAPQDGRWFAFLGGAEDQSIGRGLKNMLIGAIIGGVGLGSMLLGGAILFAATGAIAVGLLVAPSLATAAWPATIGVGALISSILALGGLTILLLGTLWFAINTVLVIIRLDPNYQPSPGTEYPPM